MYESLKISRKLYGRSEKEVQYPYCTFHMMHGHYIPECIACQASITDPSVVVSTMATGEVEDVVPGSTRILLSARFKGIQAPESK